MEKKPFVTKEQLDEITAKFPTPYHLYDEKGIRDNAKAVKEAFAWNKGYREYFAVKAWICCLCDLFLLIKIMLKTTIIATIAIIIKITHPS